MSFLRHTAGKLFTIDDEKTATVIGELAGFTPGAETGKGGE